MLDEAVGERNEEVQRSASAGDLRRRDGVDEGLADISSRAVRTCEVDWRRLSSTLYAYI